MYNIAVVVDIAAVVVVVVVVVIVAHDGQITDPHLVIQIFEGKYIPGLYFLAHAAGWGLVERGLVGVYCTLV